jgi:hypothetical protein
MVHHRSEDVRTTMKIHSNFMLIDISHMHPCVTILPLNVFNILKN